MEITNLRILFEYEVQSKIKVKQFGQILVHTMTNISNKFRVTSEVWKPVPGPFIILLKFQYNEMYQFWYLIFFIFNSPKSHFHKSEKLETCNNWLLSKLSRLLN